MATAEFRFHTELNFFLPPRKKHVTFTHYFKERPSIKDTIESLGVPHPEVYFIVVNGQAVDFSYILEDGDRIEVYPISVTPEVTPTLCLGPPPLSVPRFILDVHLGKLASSLRMLGFDTLYRNDCDDPELAATSAQQQRILLTRDRGLLMRKIVSYGYYIRSKSHDIQLMEVLGRFQLLESCQPFQRCISCNGLLTPVDKASIMDQLPEIVKQQIDEFCRCQNCAQIYWRGSHVQRMQEFIDKVIDEL